MVLGWHQHEVFSAAVRTRGTAFWQVIVFVFEALVFVLIGLSLRSVVMRLGGADNALAVLGPAVAAVVVAVVLSRFVWAFGTESIKSAFRRLTGRAAAAPDWRSATIVSWAGMRGVVTLAIALALPEAMPGRDLILFSAFAVILVTVLLQGTTIGPLIRWVKPPDSASDATHHLNEMQAWARLEAAQLAAITPLVHGPDGRVIHPRLLEQYTYRARLTQQFQDGSAYPTQERDAHYDVILAAIKAARTEMLCLHRGGLIHDEVLRALERDLDLQEVASRHARG
jgi:CPA1 family monovalent cation:H+ antiporter